MKMQYTPIYNKSRIHEMQLRHTWTLNEQHIEKMICSWCNSDPMCSIIPTSRLPPCWNFATTVLSVLGDTHTMTQWRCPCIMHNFSKLGALGDTRHSVRIRLNSAMFSKAEVLITSSTATKRFIGCSQSYSIILPAKFIIGPTSPYLLDTSWWTLPLYTYVYVRAMSHYS